MMEPAMRLRLLRLLGVCGICLGVLAAPAQASSEWIISMMGGVVRPDATWEQVRSQMLYTYYQSNPDERGVSAQGIDNLRRITVARLRSQVIAQILSYDLDRDGNVTKDEIITAIQPRVRQLIHANGVHLEPTPQQVRLQLTSWSAMRSSRTPMATASLRLPKSSRKRKSKPIKPTSDGNKARRCSSR
jgi:hypothetical protein